MLIVTGYIHVEPADADEFIVDINFFAAVTRARDGCLSYTVALDDRSAGRLIAVERWRDEAALTAHLHASDTAVFLERWQGRMTGDVLKYDALNERPLTAKAG